MTVMKKQLKTQENLKRYNVHCFDCKKSYAASYAADEIVIKETDYGERSFLPCALCDGDARLNGIPGNGGYIKPRATAMFTTPQGDELPVDKNGDIIDNQYVNDPRGWKRAGKGTKGYERSVTFQ